MLRLSKLRRSSENVVALKYNTIKRHRLEHIAGVLEIFFQCKRADPLRVARPICTFHSHVSHPNIVISISISVNGFSVRPNCSKRQAGIYFHPNNSLQPAAGGMAEDVSKKVRKPYVISKSRESWTEFEHDRFLEALHLCTR
ncbi:hypothetical protein QQ045_014077 [Rhodiola kirilowii]